MSSNAAIASAVKRPYRPRKLLVLSASGTGWWLLSHDLKEAKVDLAAEKVVSEGLRGSIREQNRAVETAAAAKTVAETRGAQAQQVAAANGRRQQWRKGAGPGARHARAADLAPQHSIVITLILRALKIQDPSRCTIGASTNDRSAF